MSAFATSSLRPMLRAAPRAAPSARSFSASAAHSLARMTITGRLAMAPELKTVSTGQEVVHYSVGAYQLVREKRPTSWFKIANFVSEGPQRDFLLSLPKGTLVCVEADAQYKKFTDHDGREQRVLSLYQRNLEVLSRPNNSTEQRNNEHTESE
ncbi:hypothetical protein BDW59DRAFT_154613 [Aspergillus cavernicola]|uniref:SsDNA binding protein n=1 Tax=Aspergillus cavernicola TaxID=176166 RepID=A0ABR4HE95_9EURO